MRKNALAPQDPFPVSYDEDFFDDMHRMFCDMGRGEVGKYMYDNTFPENEKITWEEIVLTEDAYYTPKADAALLQEARPVLSEYIPNETPYLDFGVGGGESFKRYVLPTMELLKSHAYYGIDFDEKILHQVNTLRSEHEDININEIKMDFFMPSNSVITPKPALGVMNGLTFGNMYGSLYQDSLQSNVICSLKRFSQMTNFGWLLLSIDTNQDKKTIEGMYRTPLVSKINMASLPKMEAQLPVNNFDSKLFSYTPTWIPEKQLLAHLASATESQTFWLGDYEIEIKKDQKFHMLNSYKFRESFFEDCCLKADMDILKKWHHETGVMLYLLKDMFHDNT